MVSDWPMVPLGEILTKSEEWIEIQPDGQYRQVTVRLWGEGVVLRNEVSGTQIAAKRRHVVRSRQFILSRIDARNGAFGLVPDSLEGAVVSNDFPTFNIDRERVLPRFLAWMSKTRGFVDLCRAASEGTTNRVRLKVDRFLATKIPLPPLNEQRRIVARIEELAALIEEAGGLRVKAREDVDALCRAIILDPRIDTISIPMSELVTLKKPDILVQPDVTYHFAGVYSFGRGVFQSKIKAGVEFSYRRLTKLSTGNFVYPKLMAWEGAFGIVPPECDGLVVSPEFPVFEVNEDKVLPETLDVYFRTPAIWELVAEISTGTNVRRRRLHPNNFLNFEFPLPPISIQMKLQEINGMLDPVRRLQTDTAAKLDALLPSVLHRAFRGEL
jgi:type I restriction enzyme S subunit